MERERSISRNRYIFFFFCLFFNSFFGALCVTSIAYDVLTYVMLVALIHEGIKGCKIEKKKEIKGGKNKGPCLWGLTVGRANPLQASGRKKMGWSEAWSPEWIRYLCVVSPWLRVHMVLCLGLKLAQESLPLQPQQPPTIHACQSYVPPSPVMDQTKTSHLAHDRHF